VFTYICVLSHRYVVMCCLVLLLYYRKALHKLDFSPQDVDWVFEVCAGILHLSNITFKQVGEGSEVDSSSREAVQNASHFLKINESTLIAALCARTIEVRGEVSIIHNSAHEAEQAADAVAKAIYNKLFDWLVKCINASVNGEKGSFIGVLDIFGFEIFEKNGFEQLCINFTNEKLQQHFNAHTFKDEEETYISEEIPYEPVVFIDNQPVLDLIEKKPHGILIMLDEEVIVPKGCDSGWLKKSSTFQKDHPNWILPTGGKAGTASTFFIKHYAGQVSYESTGLCERNKDSLFRNLYDMMSTAGNSNFQILFPAKDKNPRRVETLAGGFRKQLNNLMSVCSTTQPHYIRCIKPNSLKKARTFDTPMCLEQLTYAGVFEAVQIRKTGYPFRLTHGRFASRYRPLLQTKDSRVSLLGKGDDLLSVCETILSSVPQDFSSVAVGLTMILYRAEEHRILELLRNLCMDRIMPVAQRQVRRFIGYRFRRVLVKVC
jgi:myosin heavy subunit